jgi:methylenetetrahydrofolate reductase (NADPH)
MSNAFPSTILRHLLATARYEVMPTASIEEQVRVHVPTSLAVTITASPTRAWGRRDLATSLAGAGYDVVPHLAARMVTDRAELADMVARLHEAGVTKVFVPAGDADPQPAISGCPLSWRTSQLSTTPSPTSGSRAIPSPTPASMTT